MILQKLFVTSLFGFFMSQAAQEPRKTIDQAIEQGDYQAVKSWIERGANISQPDYRGKTPLHYAVANGCVEIASLLLKAGAPFDTDDTPRETLLQIAVRQNQLGSARLLLDAGYPVDAEDQVGDTALMLAAEQDKIEMIHLLLGAGADPNAKDVYNFTALHMAANQNSHHSLAALIGAGADLNKQDDGGMTPLHYACSRGNLRSIELLLAAQADTELGDEEQFIPLAHAALHKYKKIVRLLLSRAKPNDLHTQRILFELMDNPSLDGYQWASVLQFLLDCSVDTKIKNEAGKTLQEVCQESTEELTLRILKDHEKKEIFKQQLVRAIRNNNGAAITALAPHRSFCYQDADGNNPLHLAMQYGDVHTVGLVLSIAPKLIASRNNAGQTPLETLIGQNMRHLPLLAFLISHQNEFLNAASDNNCDRMIELVGKHPTVVAAQDLDGNNLFHRVAAAGNYQLALHWAQYCAVHRLTYLMRKPNKAGMTPLAIALEHQNEPLISLFLQSQDTQTS